MNEAQLLSEQAAESRSQAALDHGIDGKRDAQAADEFALEVQLALFGGGLSSGMPTSNDAATSTTQVSSDVESSNTQEKVFSTTSDKLPEETQLLDSDVLSERGDAHAEESTLHEHGEEPSPVNHGNRKDSNGRERRSKFLSRFDTLNLLILGLGTLAMLGPIAFLLFCWAANSNNATWHWMAARNYLHTIVVGLAKVLEQGITLQLGVMAAMIASLRLESGQVYFKDAASVSFERASGSSGKFFGILWKKIRGHRLGLIEHSLPGNFIKYSGLGFILALACAILAFAQTISVVLVSDLNQLPVPGLTKSSLVSYNFNYGPYRRFDRSTNKRIYPEVLESDSVWRTRPSFYTTFAEYSEPPVEAENISDTGMTLRAFLPFSKQEARQNLYEYNGPATILDARVTCQPPSFTDVRLKITSEYNMVLEGALSASLFTPRLYNETLTVLERSVNGDSAPYGVFGRPIPFACGAAIAPPDSYQSPSQAGYGSPTSQSKDQWRISICQLAEGGGGGTSSDYYTGGLVSEFQRMPPFSPSEPWVNRQYSQDWGVAYLILNVTTGDLTDWNGAIGTVKQHPHSPGFSPPNYEVRGPWYDLLYSDSTLALSSTLCYSSFMTSNLPVSMIGTTTRSEPAVQWDLNKQRFEYSELQRTLGQWNSSLSDRGVLKLLKKSSWIANRTQFPAYEPFERAFSSMGGAYQTYPGNKGNYSALMWQAPISLGNFKQSGSHLIHPDISTVWLFQDILQTGGSIAFALQSVLTTLSSSSYYTQFDHFDLRHPVQWSQFVLTNVPSSWNGLIAVLVVTFVHFLLLGVTVWLFLTRIKYSVIGETWQTASQLVTPATAEILKDASEATDDEVKKSLIGREHRQDRVRVAYIPELDRIGLVKLDDGKLSDC